MLGGRAGSCIGADFCQELTGHTDTAFHSVYAGEPASRIISRGENLSLLADMSPLCAGHLLLVPNIHYLSFAEVVSDHLDEVEHVLNYLFGLYASVWSKPIIFEHGSTSAMDGAACVTHAHWHVLPLDLAAVHRILVADGLDAVELGGTDDLAKFADRELTYFYCSDRSRQRLYDPSINPRKQYLRSVAGRLLGIPDPEWDYALIVRKDLLRITMDLTSGWCID